jgi:hypothetical protein
MVLCRIIAMSLFLALVPSMADAEDNVTWGAHASNVTISADGLIVSGTTGGFGSARANIGRSDGCRVFEIEMTAVAGSSRFGIGDATFSLASYLGTSANSLGVWNLNVSPVAGGFSKIGADSSPAQAIGTRYAIIIRFDLKKGWIKRNDVFRTPGADVAAGTGADFSFTVTTPLYPAVSSYNPGDGMKLRTKAADLAVTMPAGCVSWATTDGSAPPPPPPPTGPTVSILSDSIGYGSTAFGAPADWPAILGITAFNDGVNSLSTAGALAGSPSPLANAQAHNPKIMIVRLAVNDYALPVATSVANMQTIIQSNRTKGIVTFIQPILPVASFYGGPTSNADIIARNAAIRTMVLAEPTAMLVPAAPITASDYLADGIHPNAAWYTTKEAPNLAPYINLIR